MKHQIVDLVASGATQQWSFIGEPSAWESCIRGSGDTSYIHDDVLAHVAQLTVAQGTVPTFGFVSGLVVCFRYRVTNVAGGPTIGVSLIHNALTESGYTYTPADTTWQDIRLKLVGHVPGGIPTRFVSADVADLTIAFDVTVAPGPGEEIQVSEAWLDVEFCDVPEFYDPVTTGVTPDAMAGYLAWNTDGAEAQAILLAGILYFEDTSNVDFRRYWRGLEQYRYPTDTEITLDFWCLGFGGVAPDATCVLRLAKVEDGARSIWLTLVQDRTGLGVFQWHLGLTGGGLDVNDVTTYIASHQLTTAETGALNYVKLNICRDEDPGMPGIVSVEMNHEPILTAHYRDFPVTAAQSMGFGTGDPGDAGAFGQAAFLNFWAWRHYQAAGPKFAAWEQDVGTTNTVVQNSTDYAVAHFVPVPGPYLGMQVGQSNYCCELAVVDPAALCSVYQLWRFPDAVTAYNLFLDYRVTVFGQAAEVLVQRTSDFYYWDQAIQNWVAGQISTTLPAAMTRQYGHATMTNILSGVDPDGLLIRIRCIGGAPAHSVMVYKVLLEAV